MTMVDAERVQIFSDGKPITGTIKFDENGTAILTNIKGDGIMQVNDLVQEVKAEIETENKERAKAILKERIKEIQEIKKVLRRAEKQLNELLCMDIEDINDTSL